MPTHLGLKNNKQNFIFNASREWRPMEMFLDVGGDMGVTEKSGNASCSCKSKINMEMLTKRAPTIHKISKSDGSGYTRYFTDKFTRMFISHTL